MAAMMFLVDNDFRLKNSRYIFSYLTKSMFHEGDLDFLLCNV